MENVIVTNSYFKTAVQTILVLRGSTITKLANFLDLSVTHTLRLLNGERNIYPHHRQRIEVFLKADWADIITLANLIREQDLEGNQEDYQQLENALHVLVKKK